MCVLTRRILVTCVFPCNVKFSRQHSFGSSRLVLSGLRSPNTKLLINATFFVSCPRKESDVIKRNLLVSFCSYSIGIFSDRVICIWVKRECVLSEQVGSVSLTQQLHSPPCVTHPPGWISPHPSHCFQETPLPETQAQCCIARVCGNHCRLTVIKYGWASSRFEQMFTSMIWG